MWNFKFLKQMINSIMSALGICLAIYVGTILILSLGQDLLSLIPMLFHLLDNTMVLDGPHFTQLGLNDFIELDTNNLYMNNENDIGSSDVRQEKDAGGQVSEVMSDLDTSHAMADCLNTQADMLRKLWKIRKEEGVKFIDEEGALHIDLPSHVPEEHANQVAKRVGIIDRILQSKFEEYDSLSEIDRKHYKGNNTESYDSIYQSYKRAYKSTFEKNK